MNTAELTLISIFPSPIPITYVPLPTYYPRLPLNGFEYQPVAYNQGDGRNVYVTALVPLAERQSLQQPDGVQLMPNNIYLCRIPIVVSEQDTMKRLALFSFMFESDLEEYQVEIQVYNEEEEGGGNIGKVVMDSNMLPSDPE